MWLRKDGQRVQASSAAHDWSAISLGNPSMGLCVLIKITSPHLALHITD